MLYSAVLFIYFIHLFWNHITNHFSSKDSSNLFRWLRGISKKSISLFLLFSFKGIRSFSVREALGSSNSWKQTKNREKKRHVKNDINHRWRKLNPKVFGVSLLFICKLLSKKLPGITKYIKLNSTEKKWLDKIVFTIDEGNSLQKQFENYRCPLVNCSFYKIVKMLQVLYRNILVHRA